MLDDPSIQDLFLAEATENLQVINAALLEVEQEPGRLGEGMSRVLRSAHTLKGSAAAAGMRPIQQLVHNFESCAKVLEQGTLRPEAAVLAVLFTFLDAIEAAIHDACTGSAPIEIDLPKALADVRDLFADHAAWVEVDLAGVLQRVESKRGTEVATVRVATRKLDRQMANVEELVQLKADGHQRADQMRDLLALLETYRQGTAKLIASARAARQAGRASGGELVLDALEDQHVLAERALALTEELYDRLRRHTHHLDRVGGRLQDDIRALRLVPAQHALAGLPRMARDLGQQQGKKVAVELEGGETEVDRDLLEAIKDPVMHLLRNAIDHGVEAPEVRRAAGKPEAGRVIVRTESRAGGLRLTVRDDGRGIDLDAVRRRAKELDLFAPEAIAQLSEEDLKQLVFRAGFSTARSVTEVSGRGVGLDVVRERVEALGGSLAVDTVVGRGTEFELHLPLNLSTMRMLIVRAGGELFALPATTIDRVLRLSASEVCRVDKGEACEIEGVPVPVHTLEGMLGLPRGGSAAAERRPAVVVRSASRHVALLVDAIDGEQELVIKPLPQQLAAVRVITGAAVLSDGRLVPALGISDLLQSVDGSAGSRHAFERQTGTQAKRRRILIVDDSITTRTLEKSVLEAVGYEVEVATDGVDALAKLEQGSFDLILSDVQMPRMDGIELVRRVKVGERTRQTPVVLVSSLGAEDDRKRGLQAGADAYLDKAEFRQELLLETLDRLL